jgi:hypothetical protein
MRFQGGTVVGAAAHIWLCEFQSFGSTIRPINTPLLASLLHIWRAILGKAGGPTMLFQGGTVVGAAADVWLREFQSFESSIRPIITPLSACLLDIYICILANSSGPTMHFQVAKSVEASVLHWLSGW